MLASVCTFIPKRPTMSQPQQSFNFCPNCGKTVGQAQKPGQQVVCQNCGRVVGKAAVVSAAIEAAPVHTVRQATGPDPNQELIKKGAAAHCRFCNQVVECRGTGEAKAFVPHYGPGPGRKICKSSGRRITD